MDGIDLPATLELAVRAANAAGAALKAHREGWSGISAVIGREVKVDADTRAEALILDLLTRESPYPILSEEAGWVGGGARDCVWVVDPLDGSVNYIRGYPHCAVSIALLQGRTPILGVVDCFLLGECFVGAEGLGATLNGAPIAVSALETPGAGVLNTGIPARAQADGAHFAAFMQEMLAWRKVRMIGSAAAALAYVAAGRADAYQESGAMLWDVAGGCALVRAAGGGVAIEGPALDGPLLVRAANPALLSAMGPKSTS